jgi:cyclophilin family peptidyl-prolyl cis-trans isomerase
VAGQSAKQSEGAGWRHELRGAEYNGSQFFILHQDYPLPPSCVIFARVTVGMDVVDALANTPTTVGAGGETSRPVAPPIIKKVMIHP